MNSIMKNELQTKAHKDKLINDHLLSKIKEICVTNVADIRVAQTKVLVSKIDDFDSKSHNLDTRLSELKSHTQTMEDELPFMDEQIDFLK